MKKILFFSLSMFLFTVFIYGHACNDVFLVVKDNLAVKVDIQDGQLHINKNAKFRVYLLNTVMMDIGNIQLDVISDEFDAIVKPSKDWHDYPCLRTVIDNPSWTCSGNFDTTNTNRKRVKGKKEHFEVELIRKPGTPTGKYKIGLRLYTKPEDEGLPDNAGGELLAVGNIEDAVTVLAVPKSSATVKIDGDVSATEWKNALLCSSMYLYKPKFSVLVKENVKSDVQTRFRFIHKNDKLLCLVDFMTPTKKDVAKIFLAKDTESLPVVIEADLQKQEAVVSGKGSKTIKAGVRGSKMELEIPLDMVDLKNAQSFYVNMTRDYNNKTTYWRGNSKSVLEPMVYEKFALQ